jgi:hypothetical protein
MKFVLIIALVSITTVHGHGQPHSHPSSAYRRRRSIIGSSKAPTGYLQSRRQTWVNRKAFIARCKTRQPTNEEVEEDRKKVADWKANRGKEPMVFESLLTSTLTSTEYDQTTGSGKCDHQADYRLLISLRPPLLTPDLVLP